MAPEIQTGANSGGVGILCIGAVGLFNRSSSE